MPCYVISCHVIQCEGSSDVGLCGHQKHDGNVMMATMVMVWPVMITVDGDGVDFDGGCIMMVMERECPC